MKRDEETAIATIALVLVKKKENKSVDRTLAERLVK